MKEAIKKLKQEMARNLSEGRAIVEKADKEGRGLNAEEKTRWDKAFADVAEARESIKRIEEQVRMEAELAQPISQPITETPAGPDAERKAKNEREMRSFRRLLEVGPNGMNEVEKRDLQIGPSGQGGFLVPVEFSKSILLKLKDLVFVRQHATELPLTQADTLGVPSLEAEPADADWTSEVATGNADTTMAFGKRELRPHPLAKLLKASKKLIRSSAVPVEGIIRDRLAYKFGITEEKAFLLGTGAEQPLGMFIANANGIPVSRDITAAASTSISGDDLQNMKYGIKSQYRKNARWLIHRDVLSAVAKIKDGQGRYVFQPGLQLDSPDTLLGHQFDESEYAPNTMTAGLYTAIFGDLSYYWIADSLSFEIQPLFELYAANNQVGFLCRRETDGMPALAEAFARLKMKP
jgi:HK97 family phage major capsid protein